MVEKGAFLQGEVKMATAEKGVSKSTGAPGASALQ
jgi:hypothetical protein